MSDQELSRREKELISIGASVAAGCQPCTSHHVTEARAAGATEPEMRGAVDDALCVRRSAADVIGRHAGALLGASSATDAACCGEKSLLRELTSVSAAFAVNCPNNLADHMAAARRRGATERQIQTAIGLARTIKRVAAGHVENAADPSLVAADPSTAEALATPCGCAAETERADDGMTGETAAVGASASVAVAAEEPATCCG